MQRSCCPFGRNPEWVATGHEGSPTSFWGAIFRWRFKGVKRVPNDDRKTGRKILTFQVLESWNLENPEVTYSQYEMFCQIILLSQTFADGVAESQQKQTGK